MWKLRGCLLLSPTALAQQAPTVNHTRIGWRDHIWTMREPFDGLTEKIRRPLSPDRWPTFASVSAVLLAALSLLSLASCSLLGPSPIFSCDTRPESSGQLIGGRIASISQRPADVEFSPPPPLKVRVGQRIPVTVILKGEDDAPDKRVEWMTGTPCWSWEFPTRCERNTCAVLHILGRERESDWAAVEVCPPPPGFPRDCPRRRLRVSAQR